MQGMNLPHLKCDEWYLKNHAFKGSKICCLKEIMENEGIDMRTVFRYMEHKQFSLGECRLEIAVLLTEWYFITVTM